VKAIVIMGVVAVVAILPGIYWFVNRSSIKKKK